MEVIAQLTLLRKK